MAKVNLSEMTVEALMDLRKRVDEMLLEHRAENSVSIGRWLWGQLANAPIDGLIMRRMQDRTRAKYFWVERAIDPKNMH